MTEKKRPPIHMTDVKSSQIGKIGYDPATKTLAVKFTRGDHIYHYAGVSADDYAKFAGAESIGSHFGKHIRSKFEFTKKRDAK